MVFLIDAQSTQYGTKQHVTSAKSGIKTALLRAKTLVYLWKNSLGGPFRLEQKKVLTPVRFFLTF
jgi:hypothetical protein